jgi:hydroxymethylglutaryl-CoA reductase (NADPH)
MSQLSKFPNRKDRLEFLQNNLGKKFPNIDSAFVSDDELAKVHCENLIGGASLPLGIAGPIKINFLEEFENRDFFIPLATTEGALVASVSRGCKAISEAGGATVFGQRFGTTRAPVFYTKSLQKSKELVEFLNTNQAKIDAIIESTSSHLKLLNYDTRVLGNRVFVRFAYNTSEAMGMNMVTIATQKVVDFVEKETEAVCEALSGNYCVDKKPAWVNFINRRGFEVQAEVVLTPEILEKTLKTTPKLFFETWLSKCMLGSAMAGSMGFNAHFANVAAAFFIATGQDPAQVVEASLGITHCKVLDDGSLYVGVYLPSILLATVGGGTKLQTQSEALQIVGAKNSSQLAQVLAGSILAGEISLLASLSQNNLADSHKKLGR